MTASYLCLISHLWEWQEDWEWLGWGWNQLKAHSHVLWYWWWLLVHRTLLVTIGQNTSVWAFVELINFLAAWWLTSELNVPRVWCEGAWHFYDLSLKTKSIIHLHYISYITYKAFPVHRQRPYKLMRHLSICQCGNCTEDIFRRKILHRIVQPWVIWRNNSLTIGIS
jgi:hypothetical protein